MTYFWTIQEHVPDGLGFRLFGIAHLLWLGGIAALGFLKGTALLFHCHDEPFQTHGKSHCRSRLAAHLFDQTVIPAAAADSALCT